MDERTGTRPVMEESPEPPVPTLSLNTQVVTDPIRLSSEILCNATKSSASGSDFTAQLVGAEDDPSEPNDVTTRASTPSSSSSDTAPCYDFRGSPILTSEMRDEEQKLHLQTLEEENRLKAEYKKRIEQEEAHYREQRYQRLQFVLTKCNMYTNYLQKRMTEQQKREEELQERRQRRRKKKEEEKVKTANEVSVSISSAPSVYSEDSQESVAVKTEESQSSQGSLITSTENSIDSQNRPVSDVECSGDSKRDDCLQQPRRRGRSRKAAVMQPKKEIVAPVVKRGRKRKLDNNEREKQDPEPNKRQKLTLPEASQQVLPTGLDSVVQKPQEASQQSMSNSQTSVETVGPRHVDGELVPSEQPVMFSGGVLRPYQVDGFKWLKALFEHGVNGILADEMGLGKTIQCIALFAEIIQGGIPGPFLVCAPLSTIPNWMSEFKRFAPQIPVLLYHGSKQERDDLRREIRSRPITSTLSCEPVVITSYEIVMNDRKYMQLFPWKYIIVDEGHRLKNFRCKLVRELKMYQAANKLLLTGTPLQNNLAELWSLLNFLLPEIFDDLSSFETWIDVQSLEGEDGNQKIVMAEEKQSVITTIHQILSPFMLRRVKNDVELVIPPKREMLVYAPLTTKQKELYAAICDKTIRKLVEKDDVPTNVELNDNGRPKRKSKKRLSEAAIKNLLGTEEEDDESLDAWVESLAPSQESNSETPAKVTKDAQVNIQLRNSMMLLRKCVNHPYLLQYPLTASGDFRVDEEIVRTSGKLLMLDKMLKELKRTGHKVLIFSQMTKVLDILGDYLYMRKYDYCRLDGSMKIEDRKYEMDRFQKDKDSFIFLLSTRAGGLGLNLVAADTCIIFDSDWNPQNDLQAQDRCHRLGQTRPVVIYRLVTADTIDQRIVERASAKRKLEKLVIRNGQFRESSLHGRLESSSVTAEDLLQLLKSVECEAVVVGDKDNVISKEDLKRLLDRSDLWAEWEARKKGESTVNLPTWKKLEDVKGVFSVIETAADQLCSTES